MRKLPEVKKLSDIPVVAVEELILWSCLLSIKGGTIFSIEGSPPSKALTSRV